MLVKSIIDEDFINYKKPSMIVAFPKCDFKCDKECGRAVCQNSPLAKESDIKISYRKIIERYLSNPITKAICFAGLEPFDCPYDVLHLIEILRLNYGCNDDVVIYTGYNKEEIDKELLKDLHILGNVIIKYGRYIPDQQPHYDEILGVNLASDNQYAERL